MHRAPLGAEGDDFAHRVQQQVDVGRVVGIGFNDKGVAPPTQGFGSLFFYQSVPGMDDELVNLIQQLRREQRHVVLEGLQVVVDILKRSVAEYLAQGVVLVDQFMQTVVVAVQIQPHNTADQNRPQRHAGAAIGLADGGGDVLLQQREDAGAQCDIHVQVLQAAQYLGNVITAFKVKDHLGDAGLADGHLLILDYAHGLPLLSKRLVLNTSKHTVLRPIWSSPRRIFAGYFYAILAWMGARRWVGKRL